jgi:hypothetical protein
LDSFDRLARRSPFKNRLARGLPILHWFFIGYWILKTGLDFYPDPFLFYTLLHSPPTLDQVEKLGTDRKRTAFLYLDAGKAAAFRILVMIRRSMARQFIFKSLTSIKPAPVADLPTGNNINPRLACI